MNALLLPPRVQQAYSQWVALSDGDSNAIHLAKMLAAQTEGHSALSGTLSLTDDEFYLLMQQYFPRQDLKGLFLDREGRHFTPEHEQLVELILANRAARCKSEVFFAQILAAGCSGADHLWYDLGFWCRSDLQQFIQLNFPGLVEKNMLGMRWKKFLYRQLCVDTGINMCRSPSCQSCVEYKECFSPE
ncbi:nitrogen fixation protein NifQ [Oceanospirillum sediminis]|uniref:Nitrogen fixation protein NifQ n=1 Tax=Oceanospirillum sediminis TaxID=2760088 RepID=A0A839IQJ1_9GAMM|nr:nitrogen fixation protein NifQ [Oceanospirillum sediminis]MBB1486486.1 nitrogen fixation protein NifQ [Oceanospirillum sediminis]